MKAKQALKLVPSLLLCVGIMFSNGCASIVSKSEYPVTVTSHPVGATFTVTNKYGVEVHKATTPATLMLNAGSGAYFGKQNYSFAFEKEGHLPANAYLSAGLDGWYIGNILFGGLIGLFIVDPLTGAMFRLNPNVYASLPVDPEAVATPVVTPVPEAKAAPSVAPGAKVTPSFTPVPETKAAPLPTPVPASDSIVDQLRQLKQLYDEGLLTKDEYEVRREALVEQL